MDPCLLMLFLVLSDRLRGFEMNLFLFVLFITWISADSITSSSLVLLFTSMSLSFLKDLVSTSGLTSSFLYLADRGRSRLSFILLFLCRGALGEEPESILSSFGIVLLVGVDEEVFSGLCFENLEDLVSGSLFGGLKTVSGLVVSSPVIFVRPEVADRQDAAPLERLPAPASSTNLERHDIEGDAGVAVSLDGFLGFIFFAPPGVESQDEEREDGDSLQAFVDSIFLASCLDCQDCVGAADLVSLKGSTDFSCCL